MPRPVVRLVVVALRRHLPRLEFRLVPFRVAVVVFPVAFRVREPRPHLHLEVDQLVVWPVARVWVRLMLEVVSEVFLRLPQLRRDEVTQTLRLSPTLLVVWMP